MMGVETYLDDLADYISTIEGVGAPGVEIFVTNNDVIDGNMVLITPYPGYDYNTIKSVDEDFHGPNIQVMVKDLDNTTALRKATAIYKLLRATVNKTVGSTHFMLIRPYCPPCFLYKSNSGYFQYYVNCTTQFI